MSHTALIILAFVLMLLSLAGGGIFPWTLRLAVILLPAIALLCLPRPASCPPMRSWISPMPLLFVMTLLMLAPLPDAMHKLSPRRAQANEIANQAIQNIHAITATPNASGSQWFSLSRSRAGTIRFFLLCTAGFSAWLIIRQASLPMRQAWLLVLLILAALSSIAGILGKWIIPQGDTLLWFLPVPHGRPGPMGAFMNRNHFAGFLAILAPPSLALTLQYLQQKRLAAAAGFLSIFTILTAGIVLSLSRGGTLALIAGSSTIALLFFRHAPRPRKYVLLAVLPALATIAVLAALQVPQLRERFAPHTPATRESIHVRTAAWWDTLAIARAYPILGAGPNAFRTVYPQHRITSDRADRDFAENEYVQWIAETGIAGLFIAMAIAFPLIRRSFALLLAKSPPLHFPLAAAAAGAIAAAATHAIVDFPLRLPLYAITLASIAAMLSPAEPPQEKHNVFRHGRLRVYTLTLAAAWLIALGLSPANLRLDAPRTIVSADIPLTLKALHAAPTHPAIWRRLSAILWQQQTEPTSLLAEQLLSQAAAYDPNNYILWRTLGQRREALGDNAGANQAYRNARALRDWLNVPTLPEEAP